MKTYQVRITIYDNSHTKVETSDDMPFMLADNIKETVEKFYNK